MASNSHSAHRLTRHLFRSLMRISHQFDKHEGAKLLLYRKTVPNVHKNGMELYYAKLLDQIFGGTDVLFYPTSAKKQVSFRDLVRKEFRSYNSEFSHSDRYDTAFTVIKKFRHVWSYYEALLEAEDDMKSEQSSSSNESVTSAVVETSKRENEDDDTESTTTQYERNAELDDDIDYDDDETGSMGSQDGYKSYEEFLEAHKDSACNVQARETSRITPGKLLLAHPMVQGSVRQAVVLLLHHGSEGSYGLVLNRPTNFTFAEAAVGLPEDVLSPFLSNNVSFGGLIRRLACLHPFPDCGGFEVPYCSNPETTLFANSNIDSLTAHVKKFPEHTDQIRFYAGCCAWATGELELQCKQGFWVPIASPPDQVFQLTGLEQPPQDHSFFGDFSDSLEPPVASDEEHPENYTSNSNNGKSVVVESTINNVDNASDSSCDNSNAISVTKDGETEFDGANSLSVNSWMLLLHNMSSVCRDIFRVPYWLDSSNVDSLDL